MISIRQAKKSEIPALSVLASQTYIDAFGSTMRASELQDQLENYRSAKYFKSVIDDDTILIASEKDLMVGYVQFGRVKSAIKDATIRDHELGRLYVMFGFQGKGIGKALLKAALAHPRMMEAENIYLDVWEKNKRAQRLYKKFGFKVAANDDGHQNSQFGGHDFIMVRKKK